MQSNIGKNSLVRKVNGRRELYDAVRHRYVSATPEEMVRQAYLRYMIEILHFPVVCLSVEKKVDYNGLIRRYDIVAYSPDACALVLVECKAENVPLSGDTLYQAAMYNHELQAAFVVLFNGKQQFVYQREVEGYHEISNLPSYSDVLAQSKRG